MNNSSINVESSLWLSQKSRAEFSELKSRVSPEFWALYIKYRAHERSLQAFFMRCANTQLLKWTDIPKPLAAESTSEVNLVKADLAEPTFIRVGPRASSSFMPNFVWAPFPKIPNVRSFSVKTLELDKVFEHFGIKKKISPIMTYSLYENQACIRYVKFTVTRLRNVRSVHLYWKMVHVIMTRSIVFNLLAVSKCFERWHRELPLHLVMSWIFGAMKMARTMCDEIEYKRVYIPKPNGKKRPLGVPTPVWRVRMSLVSWFLVTAFDARLPEWQHGFRPGRGVKTAWQVVLQKVIKARYIYEFDLKGFFDNVDLKRVRRTLLTTFSCPQGIADFILRLNQSVVKLEDEDQIPEPDRIIRYLPSGRLTVNYLGKPGASWETLHPEIPQDLMLQMMYEDMEDLDGVPLSWVLSNYETVYKKYQEYQWAALSSFNPDQPLPFENPEQQYPKERGCPQGANTSPFLSVCLLTDLRVPAPAQILMYADDGLVYSNRKFTAEEVSSWFADLGIEVSLEKSSWIRENYKWRHPLKFLGLAFDPPLRGESWQTMGTLRAATRNGATLEFDKHGLVEAARVSWPVPTVYPSERPFDEYVVWSPTGESWCLPTLSEARAFCAALQAGAVSLTYRIGRVTPDGAILTDDIDSGFTWESLARSRILGLILSRMQSDSWNINVDQDFRLNYVGKSWCSKRKDKVQSVSGVKMTFANSTSFAFHDVVGIIRRSRSNVLWKSRYKAGLISADELNRRRKTIGFGPISQKATYWRKFIIQR